MVRGPAPGAPLTRARVSMYAFIAFTVVQLAIFIARPSLYEGVTPPGLDAAPHYPALRLIGAAEVGLMTVYWAGTAAGDAALMYMTVAGRLCVIPYTVWLVAGLGAPADFVGGVVQDLIGASWTWWALRRDCRDAAAPRPLLPAGGAAELALRAVLAAAGAAEVAAGVAAAVGPETAAAYFPPAAPLGAPPLHIGARSVGFMAALVGGYQLFTAAARAPPAVYAAWGLRHALQALFTANIGAAVGDAELQRGVRVPALHAAAAVATLYALTALLLPTAARGEGRRSD